MRKRTTFLLALALFVPGLASELSTEGFYLSVPYEFIAPETPLYVYEDREFHLIYSHEGYLRGAVADNGDEWLSPQYDCHVSPNILCAKTLFPTTLEPVLKQHQRPCQPEQDTLDGIAFNTLLSGVKIPDPNGETRLVRW